MTYHEKCNYCKQCLKDISTNAFMEAINEIFNVTIMGIAAILTRVLI